MALKSIADEWEGFATMVFHKCEPSQTQAVEMRKAFFAGALSMLAAMREIGEPHVSESAGVAYMEARWQESQEFYRKLIREYSQTN